MPTPDELQQLSDDIRHVGAMLVQIAHDGHPDRLLMIVRATREKSRQLGGVSVSSCFLADLSGI